MIHETLIYLIAGTALLWAVWKDMQADRRRYEEMQTIREWIQNEQNGELEKGLRRLGSDFFETPKEDNPDEEIIDLVLAEDWTPKSFIQLRSEVRP